MTKVIIDTDPGTDDAMALMMALQSPDLEVMGLTTVGGNATLAHTTRNALRVLEYLDRTEVPVHAGASRPLKGGFQYAYYFHGPGGLTARMSRPSLKPRAASAVDFLLEATRSEPGEVVLIALGPLTNVAKALLEEPRLKERLREIFVMGSAVGVPGNVTPHAEFNFYNDPRAANIVLSSGVPTTLVGLDVCDQVFLEADDVGRFGDSRAESLAARMLKNWFRAQPNGDRYNLCDPLTILSAVQPDLLTYNAAEVSVKESDSEFLGKTEASFEGGRVRVAVAVDVADAMAEFRSMLASGGESSVFC